MGTWKSCSPFIPGKKIYKLWVKPAKAVRAQILGEGTDGLVWFLAPAVPKAGYDLGFSAV